MQEATNSEGFNGYLWVINASYYSMFYMARALLESVGVRIKSTQSIHDITYHCLVNYFYNTKKLQKTFIEDFVEAGEEAAVLLGQEKAKEMLSEYHKEKQKRSGLTYTTGEKAMQSAAKTSLDRAKKFMDKTLQLLKARSL